MLDETTKKATIVANFQLAMSNWHNWNLLLFCIDGILANGGTRARLEKLYEAEKLSADSLFRSAQLRAGMREPDWLERAIANISK